MYRIADVTSKLFQRNMTNNKKYLLICVDSMQQQTEHIQYPF